MRFEVSIRIARPATEVFAFLGDFTHLPLWNYYLIETRSEEPGPARVGMRYTQRRKTDSQRFEIVEWEEGRLVTIQLMPPTRPVRICFALQPDGAGTLLTDRWTLRTPLPVPGFIARMITRPIQAAVTENLGRLAELLEQGRAQLQDGRTVVWP
jgi:hypothetical protein